MKAVYIVGIVLSVIFLFVIGFFVTEVESARFSNFYNSYNSYSSYNNGSDETMMGAIVSFFFFVFFIFSGILGLIKIKTVTNKVLSIIGLAISGIFFLWNLLMMFSPSSLSFDEVGVGFVFYSLIMLAFMIVGLIQAVRYAKYRGTVIRPVGSTDMLDS